jgi:hypothetical protein
MGSGEMKMLRAQIPGEVVKRIWRDDGQRCVLIVRNGDTFAFLEDASAEAVSYDTWPSLLDGGLYASAELAEQDALRIVPWLQP